uniref:Cation/H+ exchanger domain-containing protein n=1 Tax=Pygocentrus nattereri TaxID=42514 RepID=A0AAR2KJ67_PYGNA
FVDISYCFCVLVRRPDSPSTTVTEETVFIPRAVHSVDACTNTDPPHKCCGWLRRQCPCPPRGLLAYIITKGEPGAHSWKPGGGLALRNLVIVVCLCSHCCVCVSSGMLWSASLELHIFLCDSFCYSTCKLLNVCFIILHFCLIKKQSHFAMVNQTHCLIFFPLVLCSRFVLGAVSPAVVVPSMLLLQKDGYGLELRVPTLLMAAGSFDDILAITGFTTCLGLAFATRCTWFNILHGGLEVIGGTANLFFSVQNFASDPRIMPVVHHQLILSLQAVIGLTALDMAGSKQEEQIQQYGIDVPTVSVVSIFITAPIGALLIGL